MSDFEAATLVFKPETGWFHVFRSLVESGILSQMDGATVKVYLVIKTHTNGETGVAGPLAYQTIARKAGVHQSSVKRAIARLERLECLSKARRGKAYEYRFREKWRLHDDDGSYVGNASWGYVPKLVKPVSEHLRAGIVPPDVRIERLQININHVEAGGVVINAQELADLHATLEMMQPDMRRMMFDVLHRAGVVGDSEAESARTYSQLTDELDRE